MRLVLRSTLLLVGLYVAGVAGLFLLTDRLIDNAAWNLMEETAEMLGQEITSALAPRILNGVAGGSGTVDKEDLDRRIRAVANRSGTVASATVVDASGATVASTDPTAEGRRFPGAEELFGRDLRPRLEGPERGPAGAGRFFLDVPLLQQGRARGYLHLVLSSRRIAALYDDSRRRLVIAAGLGLVLIGVLGLQLHLEVARRDQLVSRVLEDALSGRTRALARRHVDVPRILDLAERLGTALQQERLRKSWAQDGLSHLGRLMDVGIALVDPQGRLEFAGRQASLLLGLDGGPQDVERWQQAWSRLTADGAEAADSRFVDVDLEGGRRLRAHVERLDPEGFAVLLRDRDLLAALETDLLQAAQLRGLNRLYLGVAHDLKAPLNAMVLNLELLKQSTPPEGSDGKAAETIAVLEEELGRLHRALEMMLAQTRPGEREPERFDLGDLLRQMERLLAPQSRQQGVTLTVELPDRPVPVRARRDAVKQGIVNLAVNALEALPRGGSLTLSLQREAGAAKIQVTDDGPGIPPGIRGRIFEEMHVTTKQSGTGIGLYVTAAVARGEGGSLSLVSTGPHGTHFEWTLPLAEDDA